MNSKNGIGLVLGIAVLALLIFVISSGKSNGPTTASVKDAIAPGETVTLADGLQYREIEIGTGEGAKEGETIEVLYKGTLENGTEFDSSEKHDNQPFAVTLGAGQTIPGFEKGLVGLKLNGKRTIMIPANLAYPKEAEGRIPQELVYVPLTFEVTRTK